MQTPLLTIGMPVYNGENFIGRALDSILCQSFTEFELIICDNASTDGTAGICKDIVARDNRVRYIRNTDNIGAVANFNKVFHEGRGKYFKWAAHDDELAPGYLTQCINALENDDDAVLCHSQVNVIDERGDVIGNGSIDPLALQSENPSHRFCSLVHNDLDDYEVFGVIRRAVLEKTPLFGGFIASDRILRAEIGLHGRFAILPDRLFLCRDHPERSIRAMPTHHGRGKWFTPDIRGRFIFPHWRIFSEYYKCIDRISHLSARERRDCRKVVFKWLGVHQNWARLAADLVLVPFPQLEVFLIRCGNSLFRPREAVDFSGEKQ